ncbi:MAG: MATE family efflux transporter [Thermoplasmata archaeon]|nr:MATE family efflux transporter [Thermoplasmata archaeon]
MSEKVTKGVQLLLGNPRGAIIRLSIPMMVGMLVQTIYNLADGIWVAGLGAEGLAAIGLFFPVFMGIISLASGLGIGSSSAISRRIGAKDKKGADNVAVHSLLLTLILGFLITITMFPSMDRVFAWMGAAGKVGRLAVEYSRILLVAAIVMVFNNVANGMLRGEGDTRRAMYALVLGSGLNIVLDPFFIYTLGFGVVGAAYATVLSMVLTSVFLGYWLFIKRDTYVRITLKDFSPNWKITLDILRVGVPASLSQLTMSFAMFFLNAIILFSSNEYGVAIFTSAWRITMVGVVPILGMAAATTSVTGAAYGAKDVEKLKTAYLYAIKLSLIIEVSVVLFVELFTPQVAYLFTYSKASAGILNGLITSLRILVIFLPFTPFGMMTSAMFQGVGFGGRALVVSFLRTIVMQVGFAYFMAFYTNMGLVGVWVGMVLGNVIASFLGFLWGTVTVKRIREGFNLSASLV